MGSSQCKPFRDLSKEEISSAVAELGHRYKVYCDALLANGVDGSLLDSLDERLVKETLDDLEITNRLHRRVFMREIIKAKTCTDFVSSAYDYGPSTPTSDLEQYAQVAEACFQESRGSAVMAGVHLVLSNGNQLSLGTMVLKGGKLNSKRLSTCRRLSICSTFLNGRRDQDYCKIEIPPVFRQNVVFEHMSAMTYTAHVLRDESGNCIGVVCMVDRCIPEEIIDKQRQDFLYRKAREAESHLRKRKLWLETTAQDETRSPADQTDSEEMPEHVQPHQEPQMEKLSSSHDDAKPPLIEKRFVHFAQEKVFNGTCIINDRTKHNLSLSSNSNHVSQELANEDEMTHLASNFFKLADHLSAPRTPIIKTDMERTAAVATLGMADIKPEDEIALHLHSMVRMARQVFGFHRGEITFLDHEHEFRIAPQDETDEIDKIINAFFQPILYNKDGSRFLCKTDRAPALCNYVVANNQTFVVQDLKEDERFKWFANIVPLRCYVGTPIKDSSGHVIAALCLWDKNPRPDFESAHEVQIEKLASLISHSIENWALTRAIEKISNERQLIARGSNKTGLPKDSATFVLTEIQGSSDMWKSNPTTMQTSQDLHDGIMRKLCAEHWGCEISSEAGAFTMAFHDPVDAIGFALKAQNALFDAKWPDSLLRLPQAVDEVRSFKGLRVKMAIHQGKLEKPGIEESGIVESFVGETMYLTKSLLTMALGGQILTTTETWDVAYYFMGSMLGYPQVLDHGCHVIQKGRTKRDGLTTKQIIQLVPSNLAFDYFAVRKLEPASCTITGRQFPPLVSLKAVSASFHDAPYQGNQATLAFVNLSDINEQDSLTVTSLIRRLVDGRPEFGGYQCQSEMMVFHNLVGAVLFGLHLKAELGKRAGGDNLARLVKYGCIHDKFLTMGPHRSTGRADYFGKIVNRAARLSSVAAPGSVCFGLVCRKDELNQHDDPINHPHVKVSCVGMKTLKGIQVEVCMYECETR